MEQVNVKSQVEIGAYPTHRVLAIMETIVDAMATHEELLRLSIDRKDIDILYGGRSAAVVPEIDHDEHLIDSVARRVPSMGDVDHESLELYEAALQGGSFVVRIVAEDVKMKTEITRVLERNHAHYINYYGTWVVEGL